MNPFYYKCFFAKPILEPSSIAQKQYEALRMYFFEGKTAKETALKFGYKYRGFTTIVTEFKKKCKAGKTDELFFKPVKRGRQKTKRISETKVIIIKLRKNYHSVEETKSILDGKGFRISERKIYDILKDESFLCLPRRTN